MGVLGELDWIWQRSFGAAEPLSSGLRSCFPDRWVRFHTLPDGKRYAESPAEWQVVLARHNALLAEQLEAEEELVLVTAAFSGAEARGSDRLIRASELLELDSSAQPWRTVSLHDLSDASDEPSFIHLWASSWIWTPGCLDPVLRLVAEDVLAEVMLVVPQSGSAYHPYDGGADVILPTQAMRNRLRQRYGMWLSDLPSGL